MNNDNKALFIFSFVFFVIGDLATTFVALNNGIPESGLIRIITRYDFNIMVIVKVIFFIALYLLIVFLEKRNQNYLCGAVLWLVAGMWMTKHGKFLLLFGSI
jgi:hypothetical protein